MRYAIVGSRTWTNRDQFLRILSEDAVLFRDDVILTGDHPDGHGIDWMVREEFPRAIVYCAGYKLAWPEAQRVRVSDWTGDGLKAGPLRNARLVADADVIYVLRSQGRSTGSDDVIRHALRLRKELHVYHEHAEEETGA